MIHILNNSYHYHFDLTDGDHALFIAIGCAVSEIQCFEFGLLMHLRRHLSPNAFERVKEKPMGAMIQALKKVNADSELADVLEESRQMRNYVMHNLLPDYSWPICSAEKHHEMVCKVMDIAGKIKKNAVTVTVNMAEAGLFKGVVVQFNQDDFEVIINTT